MSRPEPMSIGARTIAAHIAEDERNYSIRHANAESMAATRMAKAFAAEAIGRDFIGPSNKTVRLIPAHLAVAGFHEKQTGPVPVFPGPAPESSDEIAVFSVSPPKCPEWTHARRQAAIAALCAQSDASPDSVNIEAETLRERILAMQSRDVDSFCGPGLTDEQFAEESDAVGIFADYFEGQADFRELVQNETGRILGVDAAAKRWEAFLLAIQQTERLADCLELAGVRVRFANVGEPNPHNRKVRPALTLIPAGEPDKAVTMPNVARLNAFPIVSKSAQAGTVRSLRYFLQRELFARMMTITSGPRTRAECSLSRLNFGHKQFRSALGRVMKSRFFKRHARAFFIGTEYGTPTPISPDGITADIHFHIHAHILYVPEFRNDGRLWSHGQWSRFRRWLRMKLAAEMRGWSGNDRERGITDADGLHCELGRMIENANEACKYPFKGQDLERLIELAGPAGIRTFFEQVKGLNFAQPVGELRKLRGKARLDGKRFVIVQTPDGPVIQLRRNWNLATVNGYARRERTNARAAVRRQLKPEVIERRRRRMNRALSEPVRRQLWRVARIQDRLKHAARQIEAGQGVTHWRQVTAALLTERAPLFREIRAALETFPAALNATGVDAIAAPWFADLRDYLARTGFLAEYDAAAASGMLDAENSEQAQTNGQKREKNGSEKPPLRNHLMARCAPFANGRWRVAQPVFAVLGYTGDFTVLRKQSARVAELADETAGHIAAALRVADRTAAPPTRERGRERAPACLPGSHYPANSHGGAASWPPTPLFWADGCPETASSAAAPALN